MDFLRDALTVPESLLSIARKNAKSALIAVYLIGRLVGPLRYRGYRGGVCSINREKAGELWMQMEAIVEASDLKGVRCMKSPKHVISDTGRSEPGTGQQLHSLGPTRWASSSPGLRVPVGLVPRRGAGTTPRPPAGMPQKAPIISRRCPHDISSTTKETPQGRSWP